jgi:diaminohydroxyphosphoribosylaminopyrimidine deaminase/5-amino-6-(5-phosphoribosylamino)uracil reductase
MHLRLPSVLKVFDEKAPTIIFNLLRHNESGIVKYYQVTEDASVVHQIIHACYQNNIQSIIVEGGARLLQSFIADGMWDEARTITNDTLYIEHGLSAPELSNCTLAHSENILNDRFSYYYNKSYSPA